MRADSGICIGQRRIWFAVHLEWNRSVWRGIRGSLRESVLFKHILASSLRRQSSFVEKSAQLGLRSRRRQNIQMFFGSGKFSGKTEQFKQERTPSYIGGIISDLTYKLFDSLVQLSIFE